MYDIIVIGGGMAGMTACLYALRNGKKTLLIEGSSIGGQIAQSPKVENYPTKKQVSGEGLSQELFDQISDLGVEFEFDNIDSIQKIDNIFRLTGEFGVYEGYSVIIANGVKHRKLNLPNEDKLVGHGIYYCALCDGPFFKGREVTLIGDGNTALQYALLLSDIASKVNLVIMFDKFFGDQALVDLVENKSNIQIIRNSKTVELKGDQELESIVFERSDKTRFEISGTPLFVAIGQIPDNKRFENLVKLDKEGYIQTNDELETETEGLFAIGDCRKKDVRQITTAVSDGSIASFYALNHLEKVK